MNIYFLKIPVLGRDVKLPCYPDPCVLKTKYSESNLLVTCASFYGISLDCVRSEKEKPKNVTR